MKLENKVAIVTGSGRGIGKASALALAGEGADIVVADVKARWGRAAAGEVEALGRRSLFVRADVADERSVRQMVKQTLKAFGAVDILVNNAGITCQRDAVEMTLREWNKILRNNLTSCFLCTREVARAMIKKGTRGSIINMSSIHAQLSAPSSSVYAAAKGGMEAFARSCATEFAPHGIRVNTIEPGATYTDLTLPMFTKNVVKALRERIPLGEIARPEWVANGVVFLASDDSCYMTGEVLVIDGGYIMDGRLPGAKYWNE